MKKLISVTLIMILAIICAGATIFVIFDIDKNSKYFQSMQIVQVSGGLGNQLFQCAFAIALSEQSNRNILYDLSLYNNPSYNRKLGLEFFNTKIKSASSEQIKKCYECSVVSEKLSSSTIFDPTLLKLEGNRLFTGYFQSEKYFSKYRNKILSSFTLKVPLDDKNKDMLKKIQNTNSVSLHVRRGDYVKLQDVFSLCTLDYYNKSIEYIASQVSNPHFFIFSDDLNWVKENIKLQFPSTIVDINNDSTNYFDLELMKNCKHNIIANSTFAWWGAWLNNNPDKIVIAPEPWFTPGNGNGLTSGDIIPTSWIQIKY